jgi:protein farnesyltransferase/geranylgeranyltransferase type-1 subunit alpha
MNNNNIQEAQDSINQCGANNYYCSVKMIERGIVSAKRGGAMELTDPTMFALNFIRSCLSTIFLSPYHFSRALFTKRIQIWEFPEEEESMPKYYDEDEAWADVEPLPQDDGGLHPLAAIAYTEEYSQAMGYLRAVMVKNEFSERALALTEHIISMNPAHYTVW